MKTLEERFWTKVQKTDTCWLWTAATQKGYGAFGVGRKMKRAHRVAWELVLGPIPGNKPLDHKCQNTLCVRPHPDHLRPVTYKQNMEHRRGANKNNQGSGIRGVHWDQKTGKWVARVKHHSRNHYGGRYATPEEAEVAVTALRNQLFTHDD